MHEGLAVHMEKWRAAEFRHEAVQQARAGRIPSLDSSPHVHGSVAVEYLIERYGMARVQQLLRRMGEGVPFADAFQDAFRIDPATFQQGIRDVLVRGY
jgi:hypothetical protein